MYPPPHMYYRTVYLLQEATTEGTFENVSLAQALVFGFQGVGVHAHLV